MYLEYRKLCLKLYRNLKIYLTHITDILLNFGKPRLSVEIYLNEPDMAVGQ